MSFRSNNERLRDRLGRPPVAVDLLAVVGYVGVAAVALFQPGVYGTPVAAALGIPLLLFVPGYALVAALFPGATPDDAIDDRTLAEVRRHGLSGVERVALGFGTSLALLPVLGVALALSPWTITAWPVLGAVSGVAVGSSAVAAVRRARRPPDRRFSVPVRAWVRSARRALTGNSALDAVLNVALALAVVASAAAIGYAVAAPGPDESYTDVSLLTRNGTGDLVAADYPRNFERGTGQPVVVELTNHEGERTDYAVVAELQRVRQGDDGGATVLEDRRLATFTPSVADGGTWRTVHEVTPTMTGEDLRLVYFVYEGDPPEDPTAATAYRRVHVWVNVTA